MPSPRGRARAIDADHDRALRTYERSLWLAGIAASVSLLAVIAGVVLIGRVMSTSVDRLVAGAARFAEGDREHRIHVKVPPELRRAADEFNRMIERIRDTESALDKLAHVDGLTGLPNRRAFDEAMSESLATIGQVGESVALLTIDIDFFKQVNDTHGHGVGDEVLRAVAKAMAKSLRPVDQIFRVGGEEFAVLLHEMGAEDAREAAERLRNAVAATTVECDQSRISPTVSIGIAQTSRPVDGSAFVAAADAALYEAKNSGRNRVVLIGKAGARGQRDAA
jgi:diguanylate cyclase (GGDEF)-like protein